jgi:hypothetical protein
VSVTVVFTFDHFGETDLSGLNMSMTALNANFAA